MESNRKSSGTDYSDTGQWQMTVCIDRGGINARLRQRDEINPTERQLLESSWEETDDELLSKIENAVYDNPAVLDDYAAEIIIRTPKTLFVPTSVIDEEEEYTTFFTEVFPSVQPEDIMRDDNDGITALYFLTTGLKSFLGRTFPGAKIRNHLSRKISELRHGAPGTIRLHVDVCPDEADLILLSGENLISASTQKWKTSNDLAYRVFNLLDIYGYAGPETEIRISGEPKEEKEILATLAGKYFHSVTTNPTL